MSSRCNCKSLLSLALLTTACSLSPKPSPKRHSKPSTSPRSSSSSTPPSNSGDPTSRSPPSPPKTSSSSKTNTPETIASVSEDTLPLSVLILLDSTDTVRPILSPLADAARQLLRAPQTRRRGRRRHLLLQPLAPAGLHHRSLPRRRGHPQSRKAPPRFRRHLHPRGRLGGRATVRPRHHPHSLAASSSGSPTAPPISKIPRTSACTASTRRATCTCRRMPCRNFFVQTR